MPTVNMHEAKTQLSRLVDAALAGEEVVIARAGKPAVRLVPVEEPLPRRQFGVLRGEVWAAPDAWEPMSAEELALWYDAPLVAEPYDGPDESEAEEPAASGKAG
jgi:prevent-host-death family protein